jgi:hypothetical protein
VASPTRRLASISAARRQHSEGEVARTNFCQPEAARWAVHQRPGCVKNLTHMETRQPDVASLPPATGRETS